MVNSGYPAMLWVAELVFRLKIFYFLLLMAVLFQFRTIDLLQYYFRVQLSHLLQCLLSQSAMLDLKNSQECVSGNPESASNSFKRKGTPVKRT